MSPERVLEIAECIRKGDREPFSEIIDEYQGFVYSFSLRLVRGNRDSAYDLSSEVFLRVLTQISKYKPEYPFKSWLGRVTYTTGLNYIRKKRETIQIEDLQEDVPFQVPDDSPTPEEEVIQKFTKEDVSKALNNLKPDFRAIITLCDIEGVSYEEAASILGIPTGTVRSRLSRARSALKESLDGTL
ncbi:MAG TPA: sigma-70 family RNA polymerase sigma factor [Caldisericia bacterium]|nr:sigma-70 family RNA polymerase sigma factor [Caldisericia bacterium]HOR46807.1 sigma-70 family RNA polymerase sigma factor [Caldisericia bacterium]HOU07744.1 sigma-70 family RNA polymerase sigma factor [Caldisericia bacterium]HPL90163.1 sigma-70 family RNA polymerase sigma factor [Caldisericia bacterium]HQG59555.1 sigma-70 family RNA polymerase sigma factor [Caldisericia bacterium]